MFWDSWIYFHFLLWSPRNCRINILKLYRLLPINFFSLITGKTCIWIYVISFPPANIFGKTLDFRRMRSYSTPTQSNVSPFQYPQNESFNSLDFLTCSFLHLHSYGAIPSFMLHWTFTESFTEWFSKLTHFRCICCVPLYPVLSTFGKIDTVVSTVAESEVKYPTPTPAFPNFPTPTP